MFALIGFFLNLSIHFTTIQYCLSDGSTMVALLLHSKSLLALRSATDVVTCLQNLGNL